MLLGLWTGVPVGPGWVGKQEGGISGCLAESAWVPSPCWANGPLWHGGRFKRESLLHWTLAWPRSPVSRAEAPAQLRCLEGGCGGAGGGNEGGGLHPSQDPSFSPLDRLGCALLSPEEYRTQRPEGGEFQHCCHLSLPPPNSSFEGWAMVQPSWGSPQSLHRGAGFCEVALEKPSPEPQCFHL